MLALALTLAAGFAPGFANGADVNGPRPAPEVRKALEAVRPALDACVRSDEAADLFIELDVLAAGFVDHVTVFAVASPAFVDEPCVVAALRTLALADRGLEPRSNVLLHLAVRPDGALPHPTPRELGEALVVTRDDVERCLFVARKTQRALGGTLLVRFAVADERARAEVVGGTIVDATFRACVERALGDVHVAGAKERADIAWPLVFVPPPPPPPPPKSPWEAPTLFQFLGCGGAFPTH